ncbi:MAG: hypothetical protein ABR608_02310 [Pseudonocardiaceae bacterium]
MTDDQGIYLLVLVLGVGAALIVGQVLLRTGQALLEEAFAGQRVANSINRLVAVLFHLGALGVIALISTVDVPVTGAVQTVVTKLGIVLLILGLAHGLVLLLLTRMRARNRYQRRHLPYDDARHQVSTHSPASQAPIIELGPSLPR